MWTMPWLRILVTSLSPCRPGLTRRLLCVGFVVKKVALVQVFLWVLWFCLSVSFYQCSIHARSCVTEAVWSYPLAMSLNEIRVRTLKNMLISLIKYLQINFRVKSCFLLSLPVNGNTTIQWKISRHLSLFTYSVLCLPCRVCVWDVQS
jgi:hypothetical protein